MNKKIYPPVDIDKLIVDCRKELMKYECKLPSSNQIEKIKKQIEELEKRVR